ncbi:MAG TPA: hypothetical protein VKA84_24100 [Gemmatimonadaceae bacterium]|nr:hypothetical protein [Gemmatimonadaceae bacterium]
MENALPLFGLASVVISLGVFVHLSVGAWLRWRAFERAHEPPPHGHAQLGAGVREQLAALERAIEAQGVEIERIAEAQRYATRMLTERAPGAASVQRPPQGIITPH